MTVSAQTVPGVLRAPDTHANRPSAATVPNGALYSCTTHNKIYQNVAGTWTDYISLGTGFTVALPVVIGDGVVVVATGSKGHIEIPFACTITAARLMADASGSCVIDIKKAATYSALPTTSSICASAKPTLSSAQKSEDTTLTGWTTAIAAGSWLEVNVDSASTIKRVTLSLTLQR